ncbi:MAG TPA: SdrD B-like domain-containing protein [Tepidisphaeraceae bacterium]
MDALEPRRHLSAASPLAINFTDEVNWDANLSTGISHLKNLGVKAVRIWFGFDNYNDRPNAYDPVPAFGTIPAGQPRPAVLTVNYIQSMMKRAFELKRAGFSVMAIVTPNKGNAPTSAGQVQGLIRHLMDSTETPFSTTRLKDAIDFWEVGNEPDSGGYWVASGTNKAAGLKSFVDSFLIPAGRELHARGDAEKVVSAGVSYSPTDLKAILDQLKAKNALDAIDYAGFHPYGKYDPNNPSVNEPRDRTKLAVQYASAVGKKLVATEWNVRGFGNTGANDALWARAIDDIYKNVIQPNYELAYYFATVNNWDARGGTISARPGGLLKHNTTLRVTPTSPIAQLDAYYRTPLVTANPFYSTFQTWQYGRVNGRVISTSGVGTGLTAMTVYVDANANSVRDAAEPFTSSDSTGAYSLQYSIGSVPAGIYSVRLETPSNVTAVIGAVTVGLTNLITTPNVNFTVGGSAGGPGGPAAGGSISGYVFNDGDGNGVFDGLNSFTGIRSVFLDANRNGKLDTGERSVNSDAASSYRFDNLPAGTYYVTRVFPAGYRLSGTPLAYLPVTVAAGQSVGGVNLGATATTVVPPPPPNTPSTPTASISGRVFAQIAQWNSAAAATPWRVFIDADKDGLLDVNEMSVATDKAAGDAFSFRNLAAGTYTVALAPVAGWGVVSPTTKALTLTLSAAQTRSGQNFVVRRL